MGLTQIDLIKQIYYFFCSFRESRYKNVIKQVKFFNCFCRIGAISFPLHLNVKFKITK